jgi:hypothetical protein
MRVKPPVRVWPNLRDSAILLIALTGPNDIEISKLFDLEFDRIRRDRVKARARLFKESR